MLRRHPVGWNAVRQAVFALLPVLIGAGVLIGGADRDVTGSSSLEATQSSVAPLLEHPPAVTEEVAGPAGAEVVLGGIGATAVPASSVPDPVAGVAGAPTDSAVVAPAPEVAVGPTVRAGDVTATPTVRLPTTDAPGTDPPVTTSSSTSSSTTTSTTAAPAPVRAARSRDAGAEAEVVPLTNQDRVAAGLGTLTRDACLDGVASGYAEQLAANGVLAHNSGAATAVRGCRPGATWGDNVGTASPCDTARLEREWMASPGHRRNILTGAFTRIGVGAWTDEKGACWVQVLFSS